MRMLLVAMLALLALLPGVAGAGSIEVFPGPGTPLQDAVDAAPPGARIVVHGGEYHETLVLPKPVKLFGVGQVAIGPALGALQSSCTPAFIVDIASDDVRIEGGRGRNDDITIQGGGAAALRVHGHVGVNLKKLHVLTFCRDAMALDVADVARAKIASSHFWAYGSSPAGAPGCRVAGPATGRVGFMNSSCRGTLAPVAPPGSFGGPGLLVEDVAAGRAVSVAVSGSVFQSGGDVPVVLRGAGGLSFGRSFLLATPRILGGPVSPCITLDATSTRNRVMRSTLQGPVVDLGTANCFRRNVDEDGTPLPDDCS